MATMNRTNFRKQLQEGLNTVFGMQYDDYPEEWRGCFAVESSRKAFEEEVLDTGFGAAPTRSEGAPVAYDTSREAWTARYEHEEVALAFSITKQAVEDNLYQDLGRRRARALARSMHHTKEIKGAWIFNQAMNAAYPGGDGQPWLSESHPVVGGGVQSNMLATPADFNETSLEAILIQIRKAKDDRNIPIHLQPIGLVLPPDQEYDSVRLLRSTLRPASQDNDVNAINHLGIFNQDPKILTRLVDPNSWFILTDCPDGLKHFSRISMQTGMEGDFETDDLRYKARERYSFGFSDWRGGYGSTST